MNRDCTEFKIKFNKSDYVDSFIKALTFDFSDGSVEIRIILYGLEIITTGGRITGWHEGQLY
ncbi:hypothetical protein RhiirB3_425748 [Rhizophagus irregularis]|nr:hypothetical protein RhiirB3_425748 [Rhizophagus irregularis]